MKKSALFALVLMLAIPSASQARNLQNTVMLGLYGAGGVAWPGGTMSTNYDAKPAYDYAYAGGGSIAWAPVSFGAIELGAEYAYKRLSVDYVYNGATITETKNVQFLDFTLGWKGFVSFLYYEAGFLFGLPMGTWKNTAKVDDEDTTPLLGPDGEVESGYRHPEYGVYFGMGAMYWLGERFALQAGVQFQGSFTDSYENTKNPDDNILRSRAVLLKMGAVYCF